MTKSLIIRKVWENKGNKQKLLTIPKNSNISTGDFVKLEKVE
jgi:hypothetical protein